MGYMRHHTIIVTGSYPCEYSYPYEYEHTNGNVPKRRSGMHWAKVARLKALEIFGKGHVSTLVDSKCNNVMSFFVAPDGSKEGWRDSDKGDANRNTFVKWLEECRDDDNYSPLKWAEVQYGDEEDSVTKIVQHSSP